jgi:AraC-like DNA-binding protein
MDQQSIALYLAKKDLSATAIHRDLEETLGPEVVAYSTMTMYLRTLSFRGKTEEEEIVDHDQPLDEVDEAILKSLADEPFPSVRELARHTCLSRTTVHRPLTYSLGSAVRHLRWVPHRLSPSQKAKGFALSRELLSMLDQEETRD